MPDHIRDSGHRHARPSRVRTGLKPVGFLILAICCAVGHHYINFFLKGRPIDTLDLSNISATVPVINLHFRLKDLSQKQQHWLLNLFAFLFKGFVVRAMSYGLAQHGWKALRTTPLTIPQVDRVVALSHRKPSGLLSATLWWNCPGFILYGIISMAVPYGAIFPSGSLTVIQINGESFYAYNDRWLIGPYAIILGVTLLCIALGTKHLWSHNKTNLSFSFSHILSATRNPEFDEILREANRHHLPAQVLDQAIGKVKFGILQNGREAFASIKEDAFQHEDEQNTEKGGDGESTFCGMC